MSVRHAQRCPGLPPAPGRLHAVLSAGVAQGCATKPFALAARPGADSKLRNAFKAQLAICTDADGADGADGASAADASAPDAADAADAAAESEKMIEILKEAILSGSLSANQLAQMIATYDAKIRGHLQTIRIRDRRIDSIGQQQRQLQEKAAELTAELRRQLTTCQEQNKHAEHTTKAAQAAHMEARKETNEMKSQRDAARTERAGAIQQSGELARNLAAAQEKIEELQSDREALRNSTKITRLEMLTASLTAGLAYALWRNMSQNDPSAECQPPMDDAQNIGLANKLLWGRGLF